MFKGLIILIALSIAIIFAMPYAQQGMQWLLLGHDWVSNSLTNIFTGGRAGSMARELIALLSIPIAVGLVPTILYWVIRRQWFPYFTHIVWIIWLIQVGALLIINEQPPIPVA